MPSERRYGTERPYEGTTHAHSGSRVFRPQVATTAPLAKTAYSRDRLAVQTTFPLCKAVAQTLLPSTVNLMAPKDAIWYSSPPCGIRRSCLPLQRLGPKHQQVAFYGVDGECSSIRKLVL